MGRLSPESVVLEKRSPLEEEKANTGDLNLHWGQHLAEIMCQVTVLIRSGLYTCPPQSWRTCWITRWWRISPSPPRRSPFHSHGGSFLGSSKNNAMSHSWSWLRTLACKNRGQPLLCGNLLGFHSFVDEEQELKDARDADDDEIPVCLHQYVMELKKETHQRLIVGGERRCSILLSP